jgi:hypothetical protein
MKLKGIRQYDTPVLTAQQKMGVVVRRVISVLLTDFTLLNDAQPEPKLRGECGCLVILTFFPILVYAMSNNIKARQKSMNSQQVLTKYRAISFSEEDKGDRCFERLMQAPLKTVPWS